MENGHSGSSVPVTTGFGIKKRVRSCNNPAPVSSGKNCDSLGPANQASLCWTCPTEGTLD